MLTGTILASATLLVMMTIVDAQFYDDGYDVDDYGVDLNVGAEEHCLIDQECQPPIQNSCPEGDIGRCIRHPPNATFGRCQCFFNPGRCNTTKDCPQCIEGLHPECKRKRGEKIGHCECELNRGRCYSAADCHKHCPGEEEPVCTRVVLPLVIPGYCGCGPIPCKTDKNCPDNCHYNEKPKCKHESPHSICTCVADPHYCAKYTDCPQCKPSDPIGPFCIKPSGCPYGECECFPWFKQ